MPFLIDGYNLLRSIEKIYDETVTDVRMCQIVGRYMLKIHDSGQVIFDGIGPPDKTGLHDIANLEVIFSGANTDADTIIEEKIRINTAPKSLTVVSSDIRLRTAARTRRATDIRSDEFWAEVDKTLSKKGGVKEPSQKRHGLTDGETDEWLDIFGLDK